MRLPIQTGPPQFAYLERFRSLRIGRFPSPGERLELLLPAAANSLNQLRIRMLYEVPEGSCLAVLFAHEQQRQERRQQDCARGQFLLLQTHQRRQALSEHPVADLIVIAAEDHQPRVWHVRIQPALAALAEFGILAGVNETVAIGFADLIHGPEVLIITGSVARQDGSQSMMKIVIPLGVQTIAAARLGLDQMRSVEIAFGDQIHVAAQLGCKSVDFIPHLFEKRIRRLIENAVHRIQAQGVNMELGDPVQSVFDEEPPDFIAVGPIEVDRGAPGGSIAVRKVWTELAKVIAFGPEMIVDDIENHGQPFLWHASTNC